MMGCDESKFIEVLSQRSYGHIVAVAEEYPKLPKKKTPLVKAIKKKLGGSLRVSGLCECCCITLNAFSLSI